MIVDSSALVAVLFQEPGFDAFVSALSRSRRSRMSAGTYLESSIVVDGRRQPVLSGRLDEFLSLHRISVEPVTENQAVIARRAYRDFGRGSGNPANLNFGDCFAYALAKDLGEPLLYNGDDFAHTDIRSALGAKSSVEQLIAPRRKLPLVDPEELRRDIDDVLGTDGA